MFVMIQPSQRRLYQGIIIIICDIYIAPYSARSCSKALYNIIYNIIIIPDSDLVPPTQHISQLPGEHTTHAACIGAKRYSNTDPARPVRYSFMDE